MQQRVTLSVATGAVSLSAGEAPVVLDVTLTNGSQVVDQYDITVTGGQPDWYDVSPARVSLFPGESTTVKLSLHPPRRQDVVAGRYPLQVKATSRDDASITTVGGLNMTINPSGGFRLELPKARDEGRSGTYRLKVSNLSDAALDISLGAADPETALTFFFTAVQLQLNPYEEQELDFNVRPNRRRLKGEPHPFPFTVEATPLNADRARAAQDTQRAAGEFIYRPRFKSWPWEGLPKLVNIIVPLIAAGAALSAVLVASGAVGSKPKAAAEPPNVSATLTAHDLQAAGTAAAGSATAAAAAAAATQSVSPTPTTTPTPTPTSTAPAKTATTAATSTRTPTSAASATRSPTPLPKVIPTFIIKN
ncbi:MAG TPA: hypothetical protein VH951_00720 [Dehalococcoidia bacterium]